MEEIASSPSPKKNGSPPPIIALEDILFSSSLFSSSMENASLLRDPFLGLSLKKEPSCFLPEKRDLAEVGFLPMENCAADLQPLQQ